MSQEGRYNLLMSIMTYEGLWGEPMICCVSSTEKRTDIIRWFRDSLLFRNSWTESTREEEKTGRGSRGGVKSCMLIQQQYHFPWDKTGDYIIFLVSLPHNDICLGFSIAGRETYTAWRTQIVCYPAQLCDVGYYRSCTCCTCISSAALEIHKV